MKRIKLFVVLVALFSFFSLGFKALNAEEGLPEKVDVTVSYIKIDQPAEQSAEITITDQIYGTIISVEFPDDFAENEGFQDYEFAFWIVNGAIRENLGNPAKIYVQTETHLIAVLKPVDSIAVVYVDANGKLINYEELSAEENVPESPVVDIRDNNIVETYTKPGASPIGFEIPPTVDQDSVFALQYTTSEEGGKLIVDNEEIKGSTILNEVESLSDKAPEGFKYWVDENEQILSKDPNYSFTMLGFDRVINSVTEGEAPDNIVNMTQDLELREDMRTFVGQFDGSPSEFGFLISENSVEIENYGQEGVIVAQSSVMNAETKEFVMSFPKEILSVRAYAVYDGELVLSGYDFIAPFILDAEIIYDFSDLEKKGTLADTEDLEIILANEYLNSVTKANTIYDGNGAGGGIYESTPGMLKFGSTSAKGELELTLLENVLIKTVVLFVEEWPNDDNEIVVNEVNIAPTDIIGDRLVFVLKEETNVINISTTSKRALVFGIELYGNEVVVRATQYLDITIDYDTEDKDNDEITIVKGGFVKLTDPVRAGHNFLGWFVDGVKYEGEPLNEEVTIKAHWEEIEIDEYIENAVIFYDFENLLTGSGGAAKDAAWWTEKFAHEHFDLVTNAIRAYDGYESRKAIKFGTSSANGELNLKFSDDVLIKTVVFYVQGWLSTDKLIVNRTTYDLITEVQRIEVELDESTNIIEIELKDRGYIEKLEFYGPEAEVVQPTYYSVTFDYNDNITDDVVEEVLEGKKVDRPSNPIREGFTFEGWFENLSNEDAFDFDTPITSPITLVAKWEEFDDEIISVPGFMDFEGETGLTGSYQDDKTFVDNGIEYKYNRARDEATYPIDGKGMLFQNNTGYLEFTVPTGMGQFAFQYRKAYTAAADRKITVYINDDKAGDQLVFTSDDPLTFIHNVEILGPVKIKIQNDAGQVTIDNIVWSAYGDLIPQPNKYTVTFNANGGTPTPAAQEVVKNGKVTEPESPIKDGFVFGGWYKESGLINKWSFETDTVTSNITLYAKWTEEQSGGEEQEPFTIVADKTSLGVGTSNTTISIDDFENAGVSITGVSHAPAANGPWFTIKAGADQVLTFTIPDGYAVNGVKIVYSKYGFTGTRTVSLNNQVVLTIDGLGTSTSQANLNLGEDSINLIDLNIEDQSLVIKPSAQVFVKYIEITYSPK